MRQVRWVLPSWYMYPQMSPPNWPKPLRSFGYVHYLPLPIPWTHPYISYIDLTHNTLNFRACCLSLLIWTIIQVFQNQGRDLLQDFIWFHPSSEWSNAVKFVCVRGRKFEEFPKSATFLPRFLGIRHRIYGPSAFLCYSPLSGVCSELFLFLICILG